MNLSKLPATVVTGFLGSGKTTLLRRILQNSEGARIAVIVNEFGELGIDGDLLRACSLGCEGEEGGGDGIYELANGCICCTVQEEFFPVMKRLVERRDEIDHILIETSGLALPKPLVQAFHWPEIRNHCTVDAVITVVDGPAAAIGQFAHSPDEVERQRLRDENLDHNPSLHELFEDQLSAADLVILNKVDRMSAEDIAKVTRLIEKKVPPEVKVVQSSHGDLDLGTILSLQSASEESIADRHSHHDHHHGTDGHHHHDHDAFDSIVVELPEVDGARLLDALKALIAEHPIYRAKGFVAVPGKPMRQVVQGVGMRFEQYFDRPWQEDEKRMTRLVLIGHGLDGERLRQTLHRSLGACRIQGDRSEKVGQRG